MGYMAAVHELLNDYFNTAFVLNYAEKRHQIFASSFQTTNLPSHDSLSICRENLVRV